MKQYFLRSLFPRFFAGMVITGWLLTLVGPAFNAQINDSDKSAKEKQKSRASRDYFSMDDPREAAKLMLQDAREKGVDINARFRGKVLSGGIHFPSGSHSLQDGDRSFVEKMQRQAGEDGGDRSVTCVFQTTRFITIRETADIMMMGIRIFDYISVYGFIARVPISKLDDLDDLPFVRWIDAFAGRFKYSPKEQFHAGDVVIVESLFGDKKECRSDLMRLGVRILSYKDKMYEVNLSPDLVSKVADLEWVKKIWGLGVPSTP